jgi:hypothetical protein
MKKIWKETVSNRRIGGIVRLLKMGWKLDVNMVQRRNQAMHKLLEFKVRNMWFCRNMPPDKASVEEWMRFMMYKLFCLALNPHI